MLELNSHRQDTKRPLMDHICTCYKPTLVATGYMDSLDSIALQTENRSIFMQLWCAYTSMCVQRIRCKCKHVHTSSASMQTIKRRQLIITRKIFASLYWQSGRSLRYVVCVNSTNWTAISATTNLSLIPLLLSHLKGFLPTPSLKQHTHTHRKKILQHLHLCCFH